MPDHVRAATLIAMTTVVAAMASANAETITVKSPGGSNVVTIDSDKLTYSVSRNGKVIIEPSPLGLNLDIGTIGPGAKLTGRTGGNVNDTYDIVVGKARSAPDRYTHADLAFTAAGKPFNFHLLVRAYDDGVAFRYTLPEQAGLKTVKVKSETTQFNFAKDYDCWGANMGRFDTSFEAEYDQTKACLLYTSPSPRDATLSRMPSSA